MQQHIVGWDIGGAHVKAALINNQGTVINIYLQACPLWKGLNYLQKSVNHILATLPVIYSKHVITMTGELVDLFASRDEGVVQIIKCLQVSIGKSELLIYAGQQGFIKASLLNHQHYTAIASANWFASASWVTQSINKALLVDIGSTTTDILLCQHNKVDAQGFNDYQRLQSQELVYTGIIRTAVMAITQSVSFKGHVIGLMAEYFATMADVYRLTGELNEAHDKLDTADGQEKTQQASARRLSRMIAYDFNENDLNLWKQLAFTLKLKQKQHIQKACQHQLSRVLFDNNIHIIGAGVGRFLAKQIAADLSLPYKDFNELFNTNFSDVNISIADCAPAVAIACLAIKQGINNHTG